MTEQQPHTPTTARIKDDYRRSRVWESGNGSEAYEKEFNRWHGAEIAAAEQRGAVRALREAADVLQADIAISWNRHRGVMFMEDESDPGIAPEEWLKRRADLLEGDGE